ncbi:hypothetical protein [Litorihabitans aurantiacus]|uniref:Uncharacterized protein n=1 Tax=Litorihabitans aurantiacus TaxID=1930061 RepID=A0AA37XEV9_9MICO|nr:hypothetical protein [Litorihabitans aurantiacus]GMA32009.1 hypothetical protein GCM10025875_20010 [Litorihabitans aurantiacus]
MNSNRGASAPHLTRAGLVLAVALVALGVVAATTAWSLVPSSLLYGAGVLLTAAGVLLLLARRPRARLIAPAALLVMALALPWLGQRIVYAPPGAATEVAAPALTAVLVELPDGLVGIASRSGVTAVDPDGRTAWSVAAGTDLDLRDDPDVSLLDGGRVLVTAPFSDRTVVLDGATGEVLVDRSLEPGGIVVAGSATGLVVETCPGGAQTADGALCSYAHVADDGATTWEVSAARANAKRLVDDRFDPDGPSAARVVPSTLVTSDPAGELQLRDVATGTVVSRHRATTTYLAGADTVITFEEVDAADDACRAEVLRTAADDAGRAAADVPCTWAPLDRSSSGYTTGDAVAWTLARTGADADRTDLPSDVVLDLATAEVRESTVASWTSGTTDVIGAGLRLEVVDGRAHAVDLATDEPLWDVPVPERANLRAQGGLVLVSTEAAPLPLHELWGPRSAGADVTVLDAVTGDVVTTWRGARALSVLDGRVLVLPSGFERLNVVTAD